MENPNPKYRTLLSTKVAIQYNPIGPPIQLPELVSFKILQGQIVDNPRKRNETVRRVRLHHSTGVILLVYLTAKFNNLDQDDIIEMSNDLNEGKPWYLVSRGGISSDKVVLDIISTEEMESSGYAKFDAQVHVIKKVDDNGNLMDSTPTSSPSKSQEFSSPYKRFKKE